MNQKVADITKFMDYANKTLNKTKMCDIFPKDGERKWIYYIKSGLSITVFWFSLTYSEREKLISEIY